MMMIIIIIIIIIRSIIFNSIHIVLYLICLDTFQEWVLYSKTWVWVWEIYVHLCVDMSGFLARSQNCYMRSLAPSCHISLSVRLCVHMEQLSFQRTDLHEILYLRIFRKSIQKIQVSLNSDRNSCYFTWGPMNIYDNIVSRSVLLSMRNFLDKRCR
jgi:hypothetical protein